MVEPNPPPPAGSGMTATDRALLDALAQAFLWNHPGYSGLCPDVKSTDAVFRDSRDAVHAYVAERSRQREAGGK